MAKSFKLKLIKTFKKSNLNDNQNKIISNIYLLFLTFVLEPSDMVLDDDLIDADWDDVDFFCVVFSNNPKFKTFILNFDCTIYIFLRKINLYLFLLPKFIISISNKLKLYKQE